MHRPVPRQAIAAMFMMALLSGCSSSDDQILQQSLTRQAEQNVQMARHTEQIVETSRQLVESDARARGELIEMQQSLQDGAQLERKSLDRQHQELEHERQAIAQQRQRDPLIAAAIINVGILLACLAPLLLAYWALRSSMAQESNGIDELLIHELVTDTPVFLPKVVLALPLAETSPKPAGDLPGSAHTQCSGDEWPGFNASATRLSYPQDCPNH